MYGIPETIEVNGRKFTIDLAPDDAMLPPWKEYDGCGIVSDWRIPDYSGRIHKAPGERILWRDRRDALVYDWQGTIVKAKAEGWGLCDDELQKLADELGREPTRGQIIEHAVQRDYDRLRAYCAGDWCYVTLTVTDPISGDYECLGGIESDCEDYITELASELANEIPVPVFCNTCGQVIH